MNNLQLTRYSHLGLSIILGFLLSLIALTTIHAQGAGGLDTTFNGTGIITTPIGIDDDWAHDVAIQPDGKIVVVGESAFAEYAPGLYHYAFSVARYTVTGTLDSTFNGTGIVTTPIGVYASARSVVIQSDGKIVAAGGNNVVRYTVSGTLDSNFDQNGIVTTSIAANSVAIQSDGKIVVGGGSDNNFAVARYTITGALDSTFNDPHGVITTPIGSAINNEGASVALQSNGKIVVAGINNHDPISNTSNFGVVRYTITGVLDSTFGETGIITTTLSNGLDVAYDIAFQPDGKIVVAGFSDYDFAVARYTITGALDSAFNTTGIVTTPIAVAQEAYSVAIQPDGKMVVAGFIMNSSYHFYVAVARYQSDGNLDTTFGQTGIVTTPVGINSGGDAVALQPDGRIVVVGLSEPGEVTFPRYFAVIRYWGDREASYLPLILKN